MRAILVWRPIRGVGYQYWTGTPDQLRRADATETQPSQNQIDQAALAECLLACFDCAQACTACADACLWEQNGQELVRCIRLNLDCADICATTGNALSRQTGFDTLTASEFLEACARACRT